MRLFNYLNEEFTNSEVNRLIRKNCSHYLKLIGNHSIFTRSIDTRKSDIFYKKQTRENRIPKGMSIKVANKFNEWLEKNKHVRRDNAAICAALDTDTRTLFGDNFFIFPIGSFNYTWAETKDINMNDKRTGWYETIVDDEMLYGDMDVFNRKFDSFFHTNKNIEIPYRKKYEIWFDCKEYYLAFIGRYEWNKNDQKLIEIPRW